MPLSRKSVFYFEPQFAGTPVEEQFGSLERIIAGQGEEITRDPISHVRRVSCAGNLYYVKIYTAAGKNLRRGSIRKYIGASKISSEWGNLLILRDLGIPIPRIVAYGQQYKSGIYQIGALVTAEVTGTADLESHVRANPQLVHDKKWLYAVLEQVADYTRRMHEAGFIHKDLNWRNILVTTSGEPKIYFIDCPSGRHTLPPFFSRGRIRDLAHLDKVGRQLLSRTDLLKFYKFYQGREKLNRADREFIAKIRNFHNKHRKRKAKRLKRAAGVLSL